MYSSQSFLVVLVQAPWMKMSSLLFIVSVRARSNRRYIAAAVAAAAADLNFWLFLLYFFFVFYFTSFSLNTCQCEDNQKPFFGKKGGVFIITYAQKLDCFILTVNNIFLPVNLLPVFSGVFLFFRSHGIVPKGLGRRKKGREVKERLPFKGDPASKRQNFCALFTGCVYSCTIIPNLFCRN